MPVNGLGQRYIKVPLQRWSDWPFLRYIVLGGFSFCLNIGLTILFHEIFIFSEEVSFAFSLSIVFIVNFFTVKFIVFKSDGIAYRQFFLFLATSIFSRIGEYILFLCLFFLLDINYIIAIILTLTSSIILKFFIYKNFIFMKRDATKDLT